MNRAYGTLLHWAYTQRVETRCYKMSRADGSLICKTSKKYRLGQSCRNGF